MPWTPTEIAAATGAVTAAVTAPLTLILTKGIEALLKYRKARHDETMERDKADDAKSAEDYAQAKASYERMIGLFEARVNTLEGALKDVHQRLEDCHKQHLEAIRVQEQLKGELKALEVHVQRLWKHDERNEEDRKQLRVKEQEKIAEIAAIREETKRLEAKQKQVETKVENVVAKVTDTGPMPIVKPEQ